MKIVVQGSEGKQKTIGNTEDGLPIPRVGECLYVGYNPSPHIKDVAYIYELDTVVIILDSPLFSQ